MFRNIAALGIAAALAACNPQGESISLEMPQDPQIGYASAISMQGETLTLLTTALSITGSQGRSITCMDSENPVELLGLTPTNLDNLVFEVIMYDTGKGVVVAFDGTQPMDEAYKLLWSQANDLCKKGAASVQAGNFQQYDMPEMFRQG